MVDVDVLEGRWARVRARKRPTYRIAGNFRGVLNFVLFVVPYEVTKISTHEFFSVLGTYAHVRLHVRTREIVIAAFAFDMALFCYSACQHVGPEFLHVKTNQQYMLEFYGIFYLPI